MTSRTCSVRVMQDIIPKYGLSLYRPSTLWPPPPEELARRTRERLSNRLKSVILTHACGEATAPAPTPPDAVSSDIPVARGDVSAISQPTYDEDTQGRLSTSLGDTLLPSADKLASSSHQAGKKLAPTLNRLHDEEATGGSQGPLPSSEDPGSSRVRGPLPTHRLEPIRLQVDGQLAEINSQIQIYCM